MSARRRMAPLVVGLLGAAWLGCGSSKPGGGSPVDAGNLSSCGLPLPGSRCTSADSLERCNGSVVEDVDCAAQGRLCGPNPTAASGSACVQTGDPCGRIDFAGVCEGSVFTVCEFSHPELLVLDCQSLGAVCRDGGCTPPCMVSGQPLSATGICASSTRITRCDWSGTAFAVVNEDCGPGTTCRQDGQTGAPQCLSSSAACAGVGPQGSCLGTELTRCTAGSLEVTDCANAGQVCGYGGALLGYACEPAGASGALVVFGTVRYEDRVPGSAGLGPISPRPVRGATVAVVVDASGDVLASAVTADDGSYLLHFDAPLGTAVHVLTAATSGTVARPVQVVRPDGLVHGFGGSSFSAAPSTSQDLVVTESSSEAEAFNIFDDLVLGLDTVRAWLQITDPVPLTAVWARGAEEGTFFVSQSSPTIVLLGSLVDDDGYDDAVVLHEFGHYVESAYTHTDSPGGAHGGEPTDPRLAWSEGFANWFSSVARNDPTYLDTFVAGVQFTFNLDTDLTRADPAALVTQAVSEDTVGQILWDMADAPAPDDDPMTDASGQAVLGALRSYFRGPDLIDRGVSGVDLVDCLDGWFFTAGLNDCTALRTIVVTDHGFPYDFARPGAVCP